VAYAEADISDCFETGRDPVKTSEDYRRHAAECRVLAREAQVGEHSQQLLQLAEAWESLAVERERMFTHENWAGKHTVQ
jgi:hypothetical protein